MSIEIMQYVNEQVFGVWFLIGATLVFWMQAGMDSMGLRQQISRLWVLYF